MIYVIRAGNGELVKIGYTRNPSTLPQRIKGIKTGCPLSLKVEATMKGSKIKERCLHSFCVNRHERGEWFRLSKDEVARMVEKYKDWTPASAGIRKMPQIRHYKRQIAKSRLLQNHQTES